MGQDGDLHANAGLVTCISEGWLYTVLDTNNLHFSEEFLKFPVQANTDICADVLGFSAQYHAEESRQEFRADSCGKWRKRIYVRT